MKNSWKRFLLLQVPGAALGIALTAQALAFCLAGVPMRRDRPDELALAALSDPASYRTLLFGDSTTRNATVRYALGAPGEVGNLSTNAFIGLSGSLFLLQRYLSTHPSPEHVVVALSPRGYHHEDAPRVARYHLWRTFNLPGEREFLRTYVPGIADRDWFPAVLDVQERIVEPAFSFLRQRYLATWKEDAEPRVEAGSVSANAQAPVESAARHALFTVDETRGLIDRRDLSITPVNAEALNRLCGLSRNYGFRIELAWSPIPGELEHVLMVSGALRQLETEIKSIMEGHCDFAGFIDFNKIRDYPNLGFHNDMLHLYGDGWEQRYTSDLRKYLSGLLHPSQTNMPDEALRPGAR
jgi:hypothetical protein